MEALRASTAFLPAIEIHHRRDDARDQAEGERSLRTSSAVGVC
jgi:hypothetical protein